MLSIVEEQAGRSGTSAVSVRAAIIGASCRLPGASNLDAFWALMKSQRHGLRLSPPGRYEALELTPQYIKSLEEIGHQWGGYIDGPDLFDPSVFGMSRIEASVADPQHRLILEVVWEALENACEAPEQLAGTRTGVFVGLSSIDYAMFQAAVDPYGEHVTPYSVPGAVHCIAANRISHMLDLRGPSLAIDTACSSSSHALHMALRSLEQGECDAAIVCGANMIMTPYITKGFKRARMVSSDGLVKCFDEKTDGYVRAEGAVAIVIRREEEALVRRNRIMGVISGSAVNHDGRTAGLAIPSQESQAELIRAALVAAGVEQNDIGFVEAHGTGTYRGDETELNALSEVFAGERNNPCYVGSVKSNVGHLEAVSGLAGLLKTAMCLEAGEIPGQANLEKPMPAATADGARVVVPMESVAWPQAASLRHAGVSCLGFGGANSHIVIEGPHACDQPKICSESRPDRPVHILKLAAKKPEQLAQLAIRLRDALARQPNLFLGDICYSANIGRADFEERASIVVESRDHLAAALDAIANNRSAAHIYRGRGRKGRGKVAFLLSGAGLPDGGMGRALYDSEPRYAAAIDAADLALRELSGSSLCDHLYGKHTDDCVPIKDPAIARVALFATQYALAAVLDEFGVKPAVLIANGVGEHVAAVHDGDLSFTQGLKAAFEGVGEKNQDVLADTLNDALESAIEDGVDMVVEIGPQTLSFAERPLSCAKCDVIVTPCLSRDQDDARQFAMALAALYTSGAKIDWLAYDAPFSRKRLALPTYPFARERFWFTDGGKIAPGTTAPQEHSRADGECDSNARSAAPLVADVARDVTSGSALENLKTSVVGDAAPQERAQVLDRQDLFELIRGDVASAMSTSANDIDENTIFADLALDSIAALELLLRIEKHVGVMVDPDMFAEDMTFGGMIDTLYELSKSINRERPVTQLEPGRTALHENVSPSQSVPHHQAIGTTDASCASMSSCVNHTTPVGSSLIDDIKALLNPSDYLEAVRPDFTTALHELLFDVDFHTALGDQLSGTRFGTSINAIDMLGGFGSMLFGHNHPSLVGILQDALVGHRPQFVQMSNRTASGTLAKELVKRVAMLSGRDYKAILGNTGAEMVDAALKHALFEWTQRRDRFVSDCITEEGEAPNVAGVPPVILAIEGSYHGKTLGAYSLTWNAPGRDDLRLSGPFEVIWLPRHDAAAAAEVFARHQIEVTTKTGAARFNRIAGLFVEPVQGEGGIFPLDKTFAGTLRMLADLADCPIIVDEIQSGMGRTGAFTASSQIGLRGDYYIFGKSLGGGLAKIGALLIDSDRYVAGYGFAHTSTFGEDDHGALVGLGALRLLDEDNVEARARDAGAYLIELLQDLKARFSDVISDVRGCGLMIGIELASQSDNASPVITGLSDQDLLGLFVASHLLHRREVRVGTALSRPMTLRLEPSAYISRADIDKTVAGIEAVCRIISSADAADLLRHLAQGYRKSGQTPFRVSAKHTSGRTKTTTATTTRTGNRAVFLGHMIDSDDIGFWDKSLLNLSEPERENLAGRLVDPILVKQMTLLAPSAEALDFDIQSLPITSRAIVNALRKGQSARIVEQVKVAVADFARQGASVVGLGGLLSVITRNGLAVGQDIEGLQITTGNTYTVALAAEAVIRAAREQHIDPAVDRIGIIGAGGNIGSTLVHILTEQFQHFHLVGRKQTIARVERVADAVYDAALATLQSCDATAVRGLTAAIAETKPYSQIFGRESGRVNGAWLGGEHLSAGALLRQKIIEHYGTDPFLPVSPSFDALQNCSVIVTASNSIAPILTTSNVGPGTKIICDISVPSDVDPLLIERRPDISMVRGGVARLSDDNQFTLDMLDLPENHMLACMAETALLGFAGKQGFEAIGDIKASSVRECHELGHKLGFDLGYSSVEKPFAIELV